MKQNISFAFVYFIECLVSWAQQLTKIPHYDYDGAVVYDRDDLERFRRSCRVEPQSFRVVRFLGQRSCL